MYEHKINQTRQEILDAFITLINEKDISKITISDITKKAHVNRSTFYRHYDDKFDLVEKTERIIFNEINHAFQSTRFSETISMTYRQEFNAYRTEILSILQKHASFITAILSQNGDLTFEVKLLEQLHYFSLLGMQILGIQFDGSQAEHDLTLHFMANGILGIIRHWLNHDTIPIETVAAIMDNIMAQGILSSLGFDDHLN